MSGREILRLKKGSIKTAPLPSGAPTWNQIDAMMWEEIDEAAQRNEPGFKIIRKLLADQRFDR
jgi:hypothetical protein